MGYKYLDFMMKMQESMLFNALPSDQDKHGAARKKTADDLGRAVEKLVALLRPEIVLEIGAHEAKFSRDIKKLLPESRVVAFEANPVVYERYQSLASNAGVEYLFQCIADENRIYKFSIPGTDRAHLTMGSVLRYSNKDVFETYDVDGVRLDDFLGEITASNAMWIDVEGAIGSVLAGATESLKNCVLLFAELEATGRWEGQMLDVDVIKILSAQGLVPILRDIQRHKWQHNIVFVREKFLTSTKVQRICFDFINGAIG